MQFLCFILQKSFQKHVFLWTQNIQNLPQNVAQNESNSDRNLISTVSYLAAQAVPAKCFLKMNCFKPIFDSGRGIGYTF